MPTDIQCIIISAHVPKKYNTHTQRAETRPGFPRQTLSCKHRQRTKTSEIGHVPLNDNYLWFASSDLQQPGKHWMWILMRFLSTKRWTQIGIWGAIAGWSRAPLGDHVTRVPGFPEPVMARERHPRSEKWRSLARREERTFGERIPPPGLEIPGENALPGPWITSRHIDRGIGIGIGGAAPKKTPLRGVCLQ